MRLLADENIEEPIVSRLPEAGHDVLSARTRRPALSDRELLEVAARDSRVLITNDKDFGELTFLQRRASQRIVLLRLPAASSTEKAGRLVEGLGEVGDRLLDAMVVVEARAWRRRALPGRLA